jgi:hypothetical protein
LKEYGKFGESFDELINRILDENDVFELVMAKGMAFSNPFNPTFLSNLSVEFL